jgi:L-ascorbate metabolism protein UlaG (beta-lactamase superfamily)
MRAAALAATAGAMKHRGGVTAMKLTWFGHSAFRLDTADAVIMIDPFLSDNPVYPGTVEQAAKGTTHVILTHGHDDHIGDTVDICQANDATLMTNYEMCMYLNAKGVEKVDPGNHGGTLKGDGFTATFVRADHSSSSQTDQGAVYLGNPAGIVIKADGTSVYHMGDTDIFGDMALINELYAPDVGIVPVGDRFTMGGKVAALACQRFFDFKTVIPCHFGTFPIINADAGEFIEAMGSDPVTVLEVGGSVDI